jgi:MFS family permease
MRAMAIESVEHRQPIVGPEPPSLRDRSYRLPALGVVLVITVAAVEAMSVATVMPTVVRSLHGLRLYGWAFTGFFLADVVGMVDAGRRTDLHGPRGSLVGGLGLFAVGLLVASAAPSMAVFLAGRALQGLGAGSSIVAVYVVVARAFPAELRPRAFAALSAAWVLPALLGPVVAGAVTSAFGWRWVFAGIAPLAAIGALVLVPVLRALPPAERSGKAPRLGSLGGVALAGALAAVQVAGAHLDWSGVALATVGAVFALPLLRRLLPAGSLRLARGLPTVVMLRGVLACAFFGAEAYLPLTLTRLHHGTPGVVGIPLTLAALGWSLGSWWQGRQRSDQVRLWFLTCGFVLVAIGVATLSVLASTTPSLWLAAPIWMLAGTGMGLAMPAVSILTLGLSPVAEQGANSAALQVTDVVGSVIGIAAGASIIAAISDARFDIAIVLVDVTLAAVALAGALASRRVATG